MLWVATKYRHGHRIRHRATTGMVRHQEMASTPGTTMPLLVKILALSPIPLLTMMIMIKPILSEANMSHKWPP